MSFYSIFFWQQTNERLVPNETARCADQRAWSSNRMENSSLLSWSKMNENMRLFIAPRCNMNLMAPKSIATLSQYSETIIVVSPVLIQPSRFLYVHILSSYKCSFFCIFQTIVCDTQLFLNGMEMNEWMFEETKIDNLVRIMPSTFDWEHKISCLVPSFFPVLFLGGEGGRITQKWSLYSFGWVVNKTTAWLA